MRLKIVEVMKWKPFLMLVSHSLMTRLSKAQTRMELINVINAQVTWIASKLMNGLHTFVELESNRCGFIQSQKSVTPRRL